MVTLPDVGVVALFAERCSNGGTFLLDDRPLVGDGLGRADISNKLLDCWTSGLVLCILRGGGAAGSNSREAIAATTPGRG